MILKIKNKKYVCINKDGVEEYKSCKQNNDVAENKESKKEEDDDSDTVGL